MARNYL